MARVSEGMGGDVGGLGGVDGELRVDDGAAGWELIAFFACLLLVGCIYVCRQMEGALDQCVFFKGTGTQNSLQEDGFLLPGTGKADVLDPEPGGGCDCEGDCERLYRPGCQRGRIAGNHRNAVVQR